MGKFFLGWNPNIFVTTTIPSVRISTDLERKKEREKEEKKIPFIVATYVSACSQGQRTHALRSDQKYVRNYISAVSRQNWPILFNLLTNKSERLIQET